MQISSDSGESWGTGPAAFAHGFDMSSVIMRVVSVKEAHALAPGSVVGDLAGGLTFTDRVAAALESRSRWGWREIEVGRERWTIIVLDR